MEKTSPSLILQFNCYTENFIAPMCFLLILCPPSHVPLGPEVDSLSLSQADGSICAMTRHWPPEVFATHSLMFMGGVSVSRLSFEVPS